MIDKPADTHATAATGTGRAPTFALLVAFFIALALPVPDREVALNALRIASVRTPGAVALVGNSVLSHTSRCDTDRRTLAELAAAAFARPPLDLAAPGQSFSEALNYAAMALKQPEVEAAVMFLSPFQLAESTWPTLQTQLFLNVFSSSSLAVNSLSARFREGYALTGRDAAPEAFRYKGVEYPDYNGIKAYFALEKRQMSCPESLGRQRDFIEAMYWYQYVGRSLVHSNLDDARRLAEQARSQGKRLLVVMLPVDLEDVRALDAALAHAITANVRHAVAELQRREVPMLDLTETASAPDFADRWCACGHLEESGRKLVAQRTASELKPLLRVATARSADE